MYPTLLRSQGFQIKILAASSVTGGRDSIKCQCVAPVQNVIRHLLVNFIHYNAPTVHILTIEIAHTALLLLLYVPVYVRMWLQRSSKDKFSSKNARINLLHAEQGKEEVKKSRVEITVGHWSISVHFFTVAIPTYVCVYVHFCMLYTLTYAHMDIRTYAHTYTCTYVGVHTITSQNQHLRIAPFDCTTIKPYFNHQVSILRTHIHYACTYQLRMYERIQEC